MVSFVPILLLILACLIALPVALILLEIVASTVGPGPQAVDCAGLIRKRVDVLIPAHNESAYLLPTLADVRAQSRPGDRLLVVADNCTDDTAAVARQAGAEVVERHDPANKGKGYALAYGLQYLRANPPEVLVIVDADCRLGEGTLDRLAAVCAVARRPVQALDLMQAPVQSPATYQRVAVFAWRVKNWVRPLGLAALGLPCQLMGTGMAFPWEIAAAVDFATGSIVEDLKLGLDLAGRGHAPLFCPSASVTSYFPESVEGAETQRRRWEQGHVAMILKEAPRLFVLSLVSANLGLLALVLDMVVPPLSLLALLVIGMWLTAVLAASLGLSFAVLVPSTAALVGFTTAIVIAWLTHGRDILPVRAALSIGSYVASKFRLHSRLSRAAGQQWVRTDRRKSR
jgi:cellulose synthase/poly-beta-1,6-N-acetylglucosamine synthase-like glycosyltransferase